MVHGDYSLHNLLISEGTVYMIDVSQSVQYNTKTFVETPVRVRADKAVEILHRDLTNLLRGFSQKFRVTADLSPIFKKIIAQLPEHIAQRVATPSEINPWAHYNGEILALKQRYRDQSRRKRHRHSKRKRR